MTSINPRIVMTRTDPKGVIKSIDLCNEITFMPCDLASDSKDFYEITSFDYWLMHFNIHHGVRCENMEDIKEFYRKEGARLW